MNIAEYEKAKDRIEEYEEYMTEVETLSNFTDNLERKYADDGHPHKIDIRLDSKYDGPPEISFYCRDFSKKMWEVIIAEVRDEIAAINKHLSEI